MSGRKPAYTRFRLGEGRGGGSGSYGPAVPPLRTPTPDPSPAEPRYSEGSATQQSDRSRQQPTSVGGGEKTRDRGGPAQPLLSVRRLGKHFGGMGSVIRRIRRAAHGAER